MPSFEELADHPAIIFPAYIAALLPLTVLYALDFITEKWKPVGHTRRTGYTFLFSSVPPLCFLMFYIHLQRVLKDYKEMAAAMSAAIFCIFHILRTLWGLVQLDAFKQWNKRALRCLNNMGYGAPVYELMRKNHDGEDVDRDSPGRLNRNSEDGSADVTGTSDLSGNGPELTRCIRTAKTCFVKVKNLGFSACNYFFSIFKRRDRYEESEVKKTNLSEAELEMTVDKHMMVNSSLVDNEFESAELPCRLKKVCLLKAIWRLVTTGTTFRVSDYVECDMPLECSVRWLVVFVARFGSQWLIEKSDLGSLEKYDHLSFDEQKKVFRRRVGALAVLKTTVEERGEHISGRCLRSPLLKTPSTQAYLRLTKSERAELPYKCSGYEDDEDISFEGMSSSVREVILGWDRRALCILGSDERKSVEQMGSLEITCFAKMMSSNLPGFHLVASEGEPVSIAQQTGDYHSKEGGKLNSLVPTNTSLYRQNLWSGRFENKRIHQACVHIDNWAALESGRRLKSIRSSEDISDALLEGPKGTFHGHKTLEMRAYEYDLSRDETVETRAAWGIVFIGSVMESVRAFLAHSVAGLSAASIGIINWRPTMDRKIFPIQFSRQLLICLRESRNGADVAATGGEEGPRAWNVETRLLWELQLSFHSAVSTQAEENRGCGGLVEQNELMVLCILGFPCLEVSNERTTVNDKSETATESKETVYRDGSDTVLTMCEDGCDTERAFFRVKPVQGPQPMWLDVSVDCSTGTGEVEVVVGENGTTSNVFDWQAWKDSFMGRVQGQAEWREEMVGADGLRPREEALKSILSTPIKNLWDVKLWGGWPPLYVNMSMISYDGTFGGDRNDHNFVRNAMDDAARKSFSRPKKDDVSNSAGGATGETLRVQAQTAKQEGRFSKSLQLLCECIRRHEDPVALDEFFVLLRENGGDFVKKHWNLILGSMYYVLESSVESKRKRGAEWIRAQTATRRLEQLALCCSSLHEVRPEYDFLQDYQMRCLFELRDPKILPILQEYRAKMNFPRDSELLAAVFCFDQWKRSDKSHMRHLGEAYLETYALHTRVPNTALRIGYLFEKGILRGRQTVYLEDLRLQLIGPDISVQETACHFVARSGDTLPVVRKSTPTAVRIYERLIDTEKRSHVVNRLGLVHLLDNDGLQDLERSEALLNCAKSKASKDAMCNLAVLHGFNRGKWDLAVQNLKNAIPDSHLVADSDTPVWSHGFQRPVPESVYINRNVYRIWGRSDICKNPHTSAMNNLAVLYEMEDNSFGDIQQALELYDRILGIDENPVALFNMIVLLKLGPATVRDETRSQSLLRTLLSRVMENEHMPVFEKSTRQLLALSSSGALQKWSLAVDELENCAVFVKQLDEQS